MDEGRKFGHRAEGQGAMKQIERREHVTEVRHSVLVFWQPASLMQGNIRCYDDELPRLLCNPLRWHSPESSKSRKAFSIDPRPIGNLFRSLKNRIQYISVPHPACFVI